MRNLLNILILFLVFPSCQNIDKMEKPDDLIPKEKMADILVELALLHSTKSINRERLEQTGLHPKEYVWQQFGIDSVQFLRSNNYYAENYGEYEEIYRDVQARLEVLKTKYDTIIKREREKTDSLRGLDPGEQLRQNEEQRFRDSILSLPDVPAGRLPEPVTSDSIPADSLVQQR